MKRAGGCGFACLEMASQIYETASAQDACAVIVEPYQGSGVIVPPEGYLKKLQDWAKARGMLFIVDEIQSGMGRTGSLFRYQQEGLEPDMLLTGKALGNGMHIAAVLSRTPLATEDLHGFAGGLRRRRSGLRGCLRGVPAAGQRSSCARAICEPDTTGRAHGAGSKRARAHMQKLRPRGGDRSAECAYLRACSSRADTAGVPSWPSGERPFPEAAVRCDKRTDFGVFGRAPTGTFHITGAFQIDAAVRI